MLAPSPQPRMPPAKPTLPEVVGATVTAPYDWLIVAPLPLLTSAAPTRPPAYNVDELTAPLAYDRLMVPPNISPTMPPAAEAPLAVTVTSTPTSSMRELSSHPARPPTNAPL